MRLCLVLLFLAVTFALTRPRFPKVQKRGPKFPNLSLPPPPPYQTLYFDQIIDHFRYRSDATFKQRYLFSDTYWNGSFPQECPGPIFFYTGNESPVTDYFDNSGFFTQVLAPKHNALLVFAEHRYFGESLPFGNDSFTPGHIDYLSSEQALADYAVLVRYLKSTVKGASNCPVIAYGGSYGGMLTAWFRSKYPHLVIGGLSASAPFDFYGTGIDPKSFDLCASDTIEQSAAGCGDMIVTARDMMEQLALTPEGLAQLSATFKLCSPLQSQADAEALVNWVDAGWEDMTMLDYPYAADYGIEYPAWPVNTSCARLLSMPDDPVAATAYAIGVAYNTSGEWTCYDITQDNPDWGTGDGWPYLACTEIYLPYAGGGYFPETTYNLTEDKEYCYEAFRVYLREDWGVTEFGGFNLSSSTNIIFSNGLLDPWHCSGVLETLSDTLPAIVIPESAHHLDLRAPNDADPIYVQEARTQEDSIITQWLEDYWTNLKSHLT